MRVSNLSSASMIVGKAYLFVHRKLNYFTYFVFSFLLSDVTNVRECFVLQVLGKSLMYPTLILYTKTGDASESAKTL
jgi:hypothetical protein